MKYLYIIAGLIAGVLLAYSTTAYALSTFQYSQGGTGTTTASIGQLLYGGNTAYQSVATTSVTCSGSASCTGFTAIGSSPITITSTGGVQAVSTSTSETANQLAYWTTTSSSPAKLTGVATTSVTCTGGTTCSAFVTIGGTPITINSSVGGGTGLSSTTPWTVGQLAYVINNSTLASIATTTLGVSGPFLLPSAGTLVGGSNTTLTWTGLSTTSNPTAGQLLISNGGAGVSGTATTTLVGGGPITVSNSPIVLGGSSAVLGCATCNTSNATVSSITAGLGLNGGAITTSGTISLISYLATSTNETAGNLAYWSTTSGTPAKLNSVATTTLAVNNGLTISASNGYLVGGSNTTIGLATISANSVLANNTGATAIPSQLATSSLFSGGTGNVAYFSTTNNLVGTTTLQLSTAGLFGVGSSTPWANFSVNPIALNGTAPAFSIGSTSATTFLVANSGYAGLSGTTTPYAPLSINALGNIGAYFAIGSSTGEVFSIRQSANSSILLGTTTPTSANTSATSTIYMQKIQIQGGNSAGVTDCAFVNAANAWTVISGPCGL